MAPRRQLNTRLPDEGHELLNRMMEKAQQVLGAPGLSQADTILMALKKFDEWLDWMAEQKGAQYKGKGK